MGLARHERAPKMRELRHGKGTREYLGMFPIPADAEPGLCRHPACRGPAWAFAAFVDGGCIITFTICRGHVAEVADRVDRLPSQGKRKPDYATPTC